MPTRTDFERHGPTRESIAPRSSRAPGTGFGYELLVALIMAIVMTATVFLYR